MTIKIKNKKSNKLKKPIIKKKKQKQKPFFSSGSYGCTYYPGYTCRGKNLKKSGDNITKLAYKDEFSENEIQMGRVIQNINDHQLIGIHKSCDISRGRIHKLNEDHRCGIVDKYDKKKEDGKYVLMYSKFLKSVTLREMILKYNNHVLLYAYLEFICDKVQKLQKYGI